MKALIFFLMLTVFVGDNAVAAEKDVVLQHKGREQRVIYDYYVPPHTQGDRLTVLICTGGLQNPGGVYMYSDTRECFGPEWKRFADKEKILIIGLGFLFIPEDWENRDSYQYAQAWSGKALEKILEKLAHEFPIYSHELYLWGVSAGAQFSVRFAQLRPESVAAVAAHAAGGFDEPAEYIPVKFLLTVGKKDNEETKRLDMAREFAKLCKQKEIDVTLKVVGGLGHRQTEGQNAMSRQFFQKVMKERRQYH
jgi:poly(3-hydroxybutyrate) depolymerase